MTMLTSFQFEDGDSCYKIEVTKLSGDCYRHQDHHPFNPGDHTLWESCEDTLPDHNPIVDLNTPDNSDDTITDSQAPAKCNYGLFFETPDCSDGGTDIDSLCHNFYDCCTADWSRLCQDINDFLIFMLGIEICKIVLLLITFVVMLARMQGGM